MIFDIHYMIEIAPRLLAASVVTVEATVGGIVVAIIVGLLLAIARLSPIRPLRLAAGAYVEFVRMTPFLVQLFFLYFILPLYGVTFGPFETGIVALGLNYSAYIAEVYRAGIQGVPRGQWEAANALNLSPARTWISIILPQAIPPVIPALGNYLVVMFKDTPILSTIGIMELLGRALQEANMTYRFFEPLTIVMLVFLALSYPSSIFVDTLERWFKRK
jgi:polar amino acid transport system permease protein